MSEEALLALINAQCTWLEEELSDSQYTGYIGIDLFFYRDGECLRLHPCVEINLRTIYGPYSRHFAYEAIRTRWPQRWSSVSSEDHASSRAKALYRSY